MVGGGVLGGALLACLAGCASAAAACAPPPETLWVVAVFHKTGTALNKRVFEAIARSNGGAVGYLDYRRDYAILTDTVWSGRGAEIGSAPAAAREAVCSSRILFAPYMPIPTAADRVAVTAGIRDAVRERCGAAPRGVRVVEWLRAPAPLVLSAYFYHRTSDERWLHTAPARDVGKFAAACDGSASTAQIWLQKRSREYLGSGAAAADFRSRACEKIDAVRNASVADALAILDPSAGIFLAAFMSLWTLEAMAATATTTRAAAAGRDGVSMAFLDFADFRATYASVFRSLGVADAAAVDACVALAAPYDLATHPPPRSQNHVHQHADDALREELGAVLASSVWWHDAAEAFEVALDGVDG